MILSLLRVELFILTTYYNCNKIDDMKLSKLVGSCFPLDNRRTTTNLNKLQSASVLSTYFTYFYPQLLVKQGEALTIACSEKLQKEVKAAVDSCLLLTIMLLHVYGFDILFCVLCRIIGSGVYEESEVDWVELSKGWTW